MNVKSFAPTKNSSQPTGQGTPKVASQGTDLDKLIDDAITETATTPKTASANAQGQEQVVPGLQKLASELIIEGKVQQVKHAQFLGAAMADAFFERVGVHDRVAEKVMAKAASAQGAGQQLTEDQAYVLKLAAEDPARLYAELGEWLKKNAGDRTDFTSEEEAYNHFFDEAIDGIFKTAMNHYKGGYACIQSALAT